jgi:hypothetical protein
MSTKGTTSSISYLNSERWRSWNKDGVLLSDQTVANWLTRSLARTRTGVPNPSWRQQIARGANASTDFTASEETAEVNGMSFDITYTNPSTKVKARGVGQVAPNPWGSPPSMPAYVNADNEARQEFFKHARQAQRIMQSGVFIGELKQTLSMIKNPIRSARNLIDELAAAIRLNARRALRGAGRLTAAQRARIISRAIGDAWLSFSFGWSPLASDVMDGAEALSRFIARAEHEFKAVYGQGSETIVSHSGQNLNQTTGRPFAVREQVLTKTTAMVKYYGRVRVALHNSSDLRPMAALGLTVSDIVPTAWELVPWSFFVDYFSNVGDVIDACTFPTADIAWVSKVVRGRAESTKLWSFDAARTAPFYQGTSPSISVSSQGQSTFSSKNVQRFALVPILPPSLRLEIPDSIRKYLNIAALVATGKTGLR